MLYIRNEWHAICSDVPSNNNNTPVLPADTGEAVITWRRKIACVQVFCTKCGKEEKGSLEKLHFTTLHNVFGLFRWEIEVTG